MRVFIAEASKAQLNWLAAQILHEDVVILGGWVYLADDDDTVGDPFDPTSDWAMTGPIMEKEHIGVYTYPEKGWYASKAGSSGASDSEALVAVIRCYVSGSLGLTADVPDDLQKT